MTYLIADSGATKTEWRIVSDDFSDTIFTEGLNPYYHTTQSITDVLKTSLLPELNGARVDKIYFYGAGCDSEKRDQIVFEALEFCFSDASIEIQHDLLAAARACFGNDSGIACILGTGSNSCLYNGYEIVEHMPSLSFILGDEGSAGYFGKKLINHYFRNELPGELKKDLEKRHNMSLQHIMHGLYDGTQKSRFIASYGAFLGKHKAHPYIDAMLREGFENFITRVVKSYSNATSQQVRFVGSVACAHQRLITQILKEEGFKKASFIENPLERLVSHHAS
ncbi:MAG: hypothetical protein JXR26_01495 [Balneolaceae bacterium]|nr:hypothetical protein [Balneolaceae bacterium]